jgi:uncharacterized protein
MTVEESLVGFTRSSVTNPDLVQIQGQEPTKEFIPSRFNARSTASDGTLILYNSYSGAFTGFPTSAVEDVETRLHKAGFAGRIEGLTRYMYERGYLVPRGTDELDRVRLLFGQQQYRTDELELILLASEECNFRCVYCYETFPRGTMEPWVREAVIKMLSRRANRLNSFKANYFGGEPLLGMEAIEQLAPAFVKICDEHGIQFSSNMTTNGFLLTPDVFRRLLSWRINIFQITIDGTAEDHDCQRILKGGGETFSTIRDNILAMQQTAGEFRIIIRMNFNETNAQKIDAFLGMFAPLKEDPRFVLRFYPVGKWGGPNDESLEVCGLHGEQERRRLTILASDRGFNAETRLPYIKARDGLNVCYAARPYNFIVGADGKLMKCTIALDTKDYNIVGQVTPDGRAEIDVDKLSKWVKPYFEEDAVCKQCYYVPVCQGFSCPLPRIETGERPCPPEKNEMRKTLDSIWHIQQHTARRERLNMKGIRRG